MAVLAAELEQPPDELSPDALLTDLGLDSINAESIAAELEDVLGAPVSAALLWRFPTPRRLAEHLAQEIPDGSAPPRPAP